MAFKTVALFGANGQIGDSILRALLHCKKQDFDIVAFIPPDTSLESGQEDRKVTVKSFDLNKLSREGLTRDLKGVDALVSALNGKALEAQPTIQDAAAGAGVKRYYPSEYGMHNIYRKPGDPQGYVHPMWDLKARLNEHVVLHPAILEGKMTYTVIGCGDFYNQDRETVWCPWTQKDVKEYTLHIIGDPDAKAQYTHLDDFASYLVATLCEPDKSENAYLNFPSDTISHNEIAALLEKYTGKPVKRDIYPEEEMHKIIADPSKAPKELTKSAFPVDFWFLVKGAQGQGRFLRPPGQIHNHLFPEVQTTTFEKYFQQRYGKV
ncbi:uncharacterized protein K452DRAFT_292465 [Aplosporella prunicola CBS 121167]|uniref:NmrA-like domain-containing protein n=1 Tax=Aplosporella prunicola CBS 121167 TaxID=1176127 RepID=A0A6A6AWR0_9PEZI|nr:uncharacterized protein K452DRAFT_292465 [Aplosporella prunicola CBS 121167]KAF2136379.1 hypothetical protein K452DRAFT_292465 [Aplosporella prunicola CBS 121167]